MPVRKVVYQVSVDDASAKREAAKVAKIFQKAMGNVQTGGAAGGAAGGRGGAGGGAGLGLGGALVGGLAGYLTVRGTQQIAQVTNELSRAAVTAENLEKAFTRAFAKVESDPKKMLTSLREAAQGMSSDVALMAQAMKAMRLGVTSDVDEMSRLMEIAAKRGQEFGRSTEDAFNDITTGIGRLSPRILDNLGFLVKVDDAYKKYAETLGIVTSEMTVAQQRTAIFTEVLSQAEGEALANKDQHQQMAAAITNAKNAMGDVINKRTPYLSFMEAATAAVQDFADANKEAAGWQRQSNLEIDRTTAKRITSQVDQYGIDYLRNQGFYNPSTLNDFESGQGIFGGTNFTGRGTARRIMQGGRLDGPFAPGMGGVTGGTGVGMLASDVSMAEHRQAVVDVGTKKAMQDWRDTFKESSEKFVDVIGNMLEKVPGLIGISPVTQQQMDDAELGIPQNFADNYLRRLKDEVLNGVERAGVDIEDARAALGGIEGTPEAIVRQFEQAWEDSSLFSDPENLKFIDVQAVQAAMAKQADSEKGIENVRAMFGLGEEDAIAGLKKVGQDIYNPLAQGIQEEIIDKGEEVGELLAAIVATGFTTGVFNVSWLAIIAAAMQGEVNDEVNEEVHEDLQE